VSAEPAKSLATGAPLTEETWADFVQRLRHHCKGEGVRDHCTANAIFLVQARTIVFGIDKDYTDNIAVIFEDSHWLTPQAYWGDADQDQRDDLDATAQEDGHADFLSMPLYDQWDVLGELDDHTVTGWSEEWEYVNSHFTKEAAEAFIARKQHDYRKGLRVYVDAQLYCWEFEAIKEAILAGQLTLTK